MLINKSVLTAVVVFLAAVLIQGCSGQLRYVKTDPEAADFRPDRIALLSVDPGPYTDAAAPAEEVITGALERTGRFSVVLSPEEVRERAVAEETRATLKDYLAKLAIVAFSDPDLSAAIGEALGVEAFLVATLTFWNFTVDPKGRDIAKVGMEMRLVDAATGRILWTAHHVDEKRHRLFEPDLADLGSRVARRMVRDLPD